MNQEETYADTAYTFPRMQWCLCCVISEETAQIGWWCWRPPWKPTNVNWRIWVIWKDRWSYWKKITWPTCKTPSAWRKNCAKLMLPVHSWRHTSGRWAIRRAESEIPRSLSDYAHYSEDGLRLWLVTETNGIQAQTASHWESIVSLPMTDFQAKCCGMLRIYKFWILSLRSKN